MSPIPIKNNAINVDPIFIMMFNLHFDPNPMYYVSLNIIKFLKLKLESLTENILINLPKPQLKVLIFY